MSVGWVLSVGIDGAAQQQCPASSSWVEDGMWAAEAGLVREGGCSNHPSSHLAMTVHSRRHKFSHKVENIGTIYNRLKVQTLIMSNKTKIQFWNVCMLQLDQGSIHWQFWIVNWANKCIFSGYTWWWWWWLHRVWWWWQWWGWREPWSGRDRPLPPQRWEDLHRATQRHPRVWSHRRLQHLLPQPQGETGGPGWLQTPDKYIFFSDFKHTNFQMACQMGRGPNHFYIPQWRWQTTQLLRSIWAQYQRNFWNYPLKQTSNLHIHKTFTHCWNIYALP